jgi:hypothetical protein
MTPMLRAGLKEILRNGAGSQTSTGVAHMVDDTSTGCRAMTIAVLALMLPACGSSEDVQTAASNPPPAVVDANAAARAEFERRQALEAGCCALHAEGAH